MGVESSRQSNLPENIDLEYDRYASSWACVVVSLIGTSKCVIGASTLSQSTLEKAGMYLASYLNNNIDWLEHINILEPFAGNGVGTKIVYDELTKNIIKPTNITIKSTDVQDLTQYNSDKSYPVEYGLNAVETVKKYGVENYNILMMISPPPSSTVDELNLPKTFGYCDYFAIKEWEKMPNAKLLVFVGELGASDGSEGLYKYLIVNNPFWQLEYRQIIYLSKDIFGLDLEKELFIFKKI